MTRHACPRPAPGPAEDFAGVPVFTLSEPEVRRAPFVFNSPHSGRHYPERFLAMSRLDRDRIRRSEDAYVEELFACAVARGAPLLAANFPRAYLDANREPWELDPRMFNEPLPSFANSRSARVAGGLGTIPRIVSEGLEIYRGPIAFTEALQRIEIAYRPYHARLAALLEETRLLFGFAILIDCHSMPANTRAAENGSRPDFVIGDRFGSSAARELSAYAASRLAALGYAVTCNRPYAGGFITEHYGRPRQGVHAIQIEVNRNLYMNEETYEKTDGFAALQRDIAIFCADLIRYGPGQLAGAAIAAE